MTIDWHSHWIPESLLVAVNEVRTVPLTREFWHVDSRLRYMDEMGVERQVISWPTTFELERRLGPAATKEIFDLFNLEAGRLQQEYPDRFSALAVFRTRDPNEAAEEFNLYVSQHGLMGAVVPADAFLSPELAKWYAPILEVANRCRSHVYVHPGSVSGEKGGHGPIEFCRVDKSDARWLLEAGVRLAAAALTLETTNLLDSFPEASVHVAMLGGHLGWIADTLRERSIRETGVKDSGLPLRRIYVDTGVLKQGGMNLLMAIEHLGADRILFGSDFPQFSGKRPREAFEAAGVPQAAIDKILRNNGLRIISDRKG